MRPIILSCIVFMLMSCSRKPDQPIKIIFLHHSVGNCIWKGNNKPSLSDKIYSKLTGKKPLGAVQSRLEEINAKTGKNYSIEEKSFPKETPYGWKNYPYDYYNIWVKNWGDKPFMEESTLEILTKEYSVIIFKHCYPVSSIETDNDSASIDSEVKTLANYKLQYIALQEKMHQFPKTKFILWTPSARVKNSTNKEQALRTREFYNWVINEWDQPNDNIFLWDFYQLETEGGLYLKDKYAQSTDDSHPDPKFSAKTAPLFVNRIVDIIENNGQKTNLKGEKKK